jgi:acetylornithine deacetylase/succinyl-diaminopimelate desuccinylase-like protein
MDPNENLSLLKELIKIPSYLDDSNNVNENKIVDFIDAWIRSNTPFKTVKQVLPGKRCNLIVKSGEPNTLFFAHTDTVPPSISSKHDHLRPVEINGEIW